MIKYLGIDENGYGPDLGPLVVTGVEIELEDPHLSKNVFNFIKDSKKLKWPSARAESTALGILKAAGLDALSFKRVLETFCINFDSITRICPSNLTPCFKDTSLPVWADTYIKFDLKILKIFVYIYCPLLFNNQLLRVKKKSLLNFMAFSSIWRKSKAEIVLADRLGGAITRYRKWFSLAGYQAVPVEEKDGLSVYDVQFLGRKFRVEFRQGADGVYLPVAMASIVGKYIREIYMHNLTEYVNSALGTAFPQINGYPGREDTKFVKENVHRLGLQVDCVIRKRSVD